MNCSEWEERIALYIGADVPASERAEVERHLAECPGCQVFASGTKESLNLLRDAHQDVPDPAHFAAVRARVLATLEAERRPWWRRGWIYGAALAAAAVLLVVASLPAPKPQPHQVAVVTVPPVRTTAPPAPAKVRRVRHVHRTIQRAPVAPIATPVGTKPIVVKLVTDDPNIVIYWITAKSGE